MSPYETWTESDWIAHYAGPRFDPRRPRPGIWDGQGRRLPGDPNADPLAPRTIHQTGQLWYSQQDVRDEKIRVDSKYRSVMSDVQACTSPQLTNQDRIGFSQQFDAWQRFYCGDEPGCGQPSASATGSGSQEMQQIRNMEQTLYVWQQKLTAKGCTLSAPIEKPKAPGKEEPGKSWLDSIENIVIGVAVIAVAVTVLPRLTGRGSAGAGGGGGGGGGGGRAPSGTLTYRAGSAVGRAMGGVRRWAET